MGIKSRAADSIRFSWIIVENEEFTILQAFAKFM